MARLGFGKASDWYQYLKDHNYPRRPKLQVLCMNCQFVKASENMEWAGTSNASPRLKSIPNPPPKPVTESASKPLAEPVMETPKPETPKRGTVNFPFLKYGDIPEKGFRKATIVEPPQLMDTKWGKLPQIALEFEDGDLRRWSMNKTTYTNLLDGFGNVASKWVRKIIRLKLERFDFGGKQVTGIIGEPLK